MCLLLGSQYCKHRSVIVFTGNLVSPKANRVRIRKILPTNCRTSIRVESPKDEETTVQEDFQDRGSVLITSYL